MTICPKLGRFEKAERSPGIRGVAAVRMGIVESLGARGVAVDVLHPLRNHGSVRLNIYVINGIR